MSTQPDRSRRVKLLSESIRFFLALFISCFLLSWFFSGLMFIIPSITLALLAISLSTRLENIGIGNKDHQSNTSLSLAAKLPLNLYIAGISVLAVVSSMAVVSNFMNLETFEQIVRSIPSYAIKDSTKYSFIDVMKDNIFNNPIHTLNREFFNPITGLITGALVFLLKQHSDNLTKFISSILLAIIFMLFLHASIGGSLEFRKSISQEPSDNLIKYDGTIYLKTYYLMNNQDYYHAYVEASSRTPAYIRDKAVIDGKFRGYITSPFIFREPTMFYMWKYFTFNSGALISFLAIVLAGVIYFVSWSSARNLWGEWGILVPITIMPYLWVSLVWANILLPDFWAGLCVYAGLMLWVSKKYVHSVSFLFLAALFREVTIIFAVILLIFSLIRRDEGKIAYLGGILLFSIIYSVHYLTASKYIESSITSIQSISTHLDLYSLSFQKFLPASSYLMFPYGFYIFPSFIVAIVALIALACHRRWDHALIVGFSLVYFYVAPSSYWGQHVMLFIITWAVSILLIGINKHEEEGPRSVA